MKPSVFLIDDNETDKYIAQRILEKSKLFGRIYCFNNGLEAYEHLSNSKDDQNEWQLPAIIVLDINMPIMDGFQFLEKYQEMAVKKSWKHNLITMLTSSADPTDKKKAMGYSVVKNFLQKPFQKDYAQELFKNYELVRQVA